MQHSREHPFAKPESAGPGPCPGPDPESGPVADSPHSSSDDTLDLHLPGELTALLAASDSAAETPVPVPAPPPPEEGAHAGHSRPSGADPALLDSVDTWPATHTPVGALQLVPVRLARDLPLLAAWMNAPAVAAFWELSGPAETTAAHVRAQLEGDGRSVPCLGVLDGTPMSYWEIYRADLDPVARYCQARPQDTGLHLLIGGVADRGRGVGTALLRAVADLVLDQRPGCGRVLAEPDLRNTASISAFLSAGFRFSAEVELPEKRAALMVRDRELRTAL
ncbi:GNAT family N-acetyltransferase [Streptomyces sp. NPDC054796]